MCDKIEVLGIRLDYLNVEQEMERLAEFIENDRLDSIGIITMNTLLLAEKEPDWKRYLENLDMSVISEKEILACAFWELIMMKKMIKLPKKKFL